jgi:linoleate 10R-lipoxygenase
MPKNLHYSYRAADGSNYNPLIPGIGKAGSPYARTVPSTNLTPLSTLPDAELVFDVLLKQDEFKPHPDGISSLFFAMADLIIHCIFHTNTDDPAINLASSYLDLSILYGSSDDDVNSVRSFNGRGGLKPDCFADGRLLGMPPATCALLVLLNRNHNVWSSIPYLMCR